MFNRSENSRSPSLFVQTAFQKQQAFKFKLASTLAVIFKLVGSAETSSVYFENKGKHDNTLTCSGNQAKALYALLQQNCGSYKTKFDDCANYFFDQLDFGHGYFAGPACELRFHLETDNCTVDTLQANVADGYGSNLDYFITVLITLAVLGTITCCLSRFKIPSSVGEHTPLINSVPSDEKTAPTLV